MLNTNLWTDLSTVKYLVPSISKETLKPRTRSSFSVVFEVDLWLARKHLRSFLIVSVTLKLSDF